VRFLLPSTITLIRMSPVRRRLTAARSLASGVAGVARASWVTAARRAHPRVSGRLSVEGVDARVEVLRDRYGGPHVFASTEADALFGQGFVHAQDRLFQMDAMRRLAAGRLSEVAGPAALGSDRFMRRLGLARLAHSDAQRSAPADLALIEAYARGVNAAIASLPALPPEFALMATEPEPWRAEDCMLAGRLIVFGFAGNWDTELLREELLHLLGPERAAAVDPAYPGKRLTHSGHLSHAAEERILEAYESAVEAGLLVGGASNAWAVTGSRTASGAPLLASDPHLNARLPGFFHVSHIAGGGIDAVGADLAGIPGVAIGHNGAMAWGLTAGMADVSDCYVETVDPQDPARYLTPEGWVPGEVRRERIAVRGAGTVEEVVLVTRHGPVIGPVLPGEDRAVALRSTALEEGDIVSPFLGMWSARDPEAFEAALRRWPGATFNWVYAHAGGSVGYLMAGGIPRREPPVGLLPQDGATSPGPPPAYEAAQMPCSVNPPSGIVASANHAPGGDLPLGEEWCEPWRAERITALLEARERHDVESFRSMQLDVQSEALSQLRALLGDRGTVSSPDVLAVVEAWDGSLAAESAGAAVMEVVYQELARELATRLAGSGARIVLGSGIEAVLAHSSFHYRLQGWVLDHLRLGREPWGDEPARDRALAAAVSRAERRLSEELGDDASRWSWGALHQLTMHHPLRRVPGLGRWFSRGPFPFPGDVNTVCQGGYSIYSGPGRAAFTPTYRQVIDLGDFDRSVFQLPAGNSGIPGHPRYDDCIEEYLRGDVRPLLYSRQAVDAAVEHSLVLEPR
jgi:penicillin amidase